MTSTLTASAPRRLAGDAAITTFSVEVVDGNGREVAAQPVTVRYCYPDGQEWWSTAVTDREGRARFWDRHPSAPQAVTVVSGREELRVDRPAPAALLTLEM